MSGTAWLRDAWLFLRRWSVPPAAAVAIVLTGAIATWANKVVPVPLGSAPVPLWTYLPAATAMAAGAIVAGRPSAAELATPRAVWQLEALRAVAAIVVSSTGLLGAAVSIGVQQVVLWSAVFTALALLSAAVLGRFYWLPVFGTAVLYVLVASNVGLNSRLTVSVDGRVDSTVALLLVAVAFLTYTARSAHYGLLRRPSRWASLFKPDQ